MKKYEIEALLKSFSIFFVLQSILLAVIVLQSYKQGRHSIDDHIRSQMKICSFDLKCEGLELDFVPKTDERKVRKLYKDGDVYSFFEVPTADEYLLKVILPQKTYERRVYELKKDLFKKFIIYTLIIALLSFVFSLYSLRPLKRALDLNEEFVKDILHDINTPLSSMIVNFKLFKKEIGENKKIDRMQNSISTILSLQNNLRAFLDNSLLQKEEFELLDIIKKRIEYFNMIYPNVLFEVYVRKCKLFTNKDAFIRILDNLLSNACKYTQKEGKITLKSNDAMLYIEDNGQGIKNVNKIFDRFYKEGDRGLGIGMHIVKKLCDESAITILVKSEVGVGTVVKLDLSKVIVK